MAVNIFSFPFRQIGFLLRQLSLSGSVGNAAALILYAGICLLPVIWLGVRILRFNRKFQPLDLWLPAISAGLFFVIYVMINPGCLPTEMAFMEGSDLCVCLWSAIVFYAVMGVLKTVRYSDEVKLLRYLQIGIIVLAVILLLLMPAGIFTQLLPQIDAVKSGNADPARGLIGGAVYEDPLSTTIAFLWLKYLMDCIPMIALLPVLWAGYRLTKCFGQDQYGGDTITAIEQLCGTCLRVLPVMVAEPFIMNMIQLVGSGLRSLTFHISFPAVEIVLVICVFLLAKFFASAKALKDENQMII